MRTSSAPIRDTRQKRAIRHILDRADRPLSPEEILSGAARESEGLGIATVYRTLKGLVEDGWVSIVEVPGRAGLYERSGKGHHHHFVCERCEKVYELEGCEVTADLPKGFRARDHDVTIYGTCAQCTAAKRRRST